MKPDPRNVRQTREARLHAIHALAKRERVNLPDLAKRLNLPQSYVWGLLQSLLRRGLIERVGVRVSTRGMPATTFAAVAEKPEGQAA